MTGTEYENNITSLNMEHESYANYIEESKKMIASAITDMGVATSNQETLEMMANNIRNLPSKSRGFEFSLSSGPNGSGCTSVGQFHIKIGEYKKLTIPFSKGIVATGGTVSFQYLRIDVGGTVIKQWTSLPTTDYELDLTQYDSTKKLVVILAANTSGAWGSYRIDQITVQ